MHAAERPTRDDFRAAGLWSPDAPDAAERLALLEWLASRGIPLDEMRAAHAVGRLAGLAADRMLRPPPRLTREALAASSGVAPEDVDRLLLVAGLPPTRPGRAAFSPSDAVVFEMLRRSTAVFGEDGALQFVRVIGASLSRIAEAAVAGYLTALERPLRSGGATPLDLARANAEAMETLEPLPGMLTALFRGHLETAIRRFHRARRADAPAEAAPPTIGFVDLVGYTPLATRLSATDLAAVVDRFEATATDIVTSRDGRLVKLVGDAVMFVSFDATAACDIALTLVERFAADAHVTPRGGLARGDVLVRGGDYYGPVVNLAARLADLAVPHEVLVTHEVVEAVAAAPLRFAPAGKRLLKGFERPVALHAVERG